MARDTPPARQRNRRGEGHLLRDEIIAGATAILESTGSEEALTLRGIARQIGISAPSVTIHFADRADIIDAVIADELAQLHRLVEAAAGSSPDPVECYLATARAYVRFGRDHPARYRLLFNRRYIPEWETQQRPMPQTDPLITATLAVPVRALQACIDAGRSTSVDPSTDSIAVWFFLHGLTTIPAAITSLPWPDLDQFLTTTVTGLAHLSPLAPRPGARKRRPTSPRAPSR